MVIVFLRAFTIATRRVPFAACLIVHLALLSAFLLIWPNGVPLLHGTLYEQARWFDAAILGCVLPWSSVRLPATADANSRTRLAVLSGVRPTLVALGSLFAIATSLALIAVTGMPLLIRAQEMSAGPWTRVAQDELALVAFACAVAAIGAAAGGLGDRVFRWLLAASSTMLLGGATWRIVHHSLEAAGVFAGVGAIVTLLLVQRAAVSRRYLVEHQV